jgi:hypothetical protein
MSHMSRDGLYLLLLGMAVFFMVGSAAAYTAGWGMADFEGYYYPAKCLLQDGDPYKTGDVLRVIQRERHVKSIEETMAISIATHSVHPPSEFVLTVPLSLLPHSLAEAIWFLANAVTLSVAAFLVWRWGTEVQAPTLSGVLAGVVLANSAMPIAGGNAAGIAVGLAIIATWCFSVDRCSGLAVVCLALSLMLKPHDAGLIWLFLLFSKGTFRKRALQVLGLVSGLSIPIVVWLFHNAGNWPRELEDNLAFLGAPGQINDPNLSNSMINLQMATSLLTPNPEIYNAVTYAVCGILWLFWASKAIRSRPTVAGTRLALAALAPLSLLVVYHRTTDATLLLLCVPALAAIWAIESGVIRNLAIGLAFAAILSTGDLIRIGLVVGVGPLRTHHRQVADYLSHSFLALLAPLTLLGVCIFHLVVYRRLDRQRVRRA